MSLKILILVNFEAKGSRFRYWRKFEGWFCSEKSTIFCSKDIKRSVMNKTKAFYYSWYLNNCFLWNSGPLKIRQLQCSTLIWTIIYSQDISTQKAPHSKLYRILILFFLAKFQAHCQSLKINNCPQLISEFGYEAVSRDNICKTQCSFVLNALNPEGNPNGQQARPPHQNFFIESDTLQAPGFFGNIGAGISSFGETISNSATPGVGSGTSGGVSNEQLLPESNLPPPLNNNQNAGNPTILTSTIIPSPQNINGRPFRGPTTAIGGLGRPGGPLLPPQAPLPPGPPRPPRPPPNFNAASQQSSIVAPPPPLGVTGGTVGVNANGASGQNLPNVNPTRQPRPLFNLIPRLPNFSELFGI